MLLSLLALAASAVALPAFDLTARSNCMSTSDASNIVAIYAALIANYTAANGQEYCSTNFVDTSDSINTFIHQPLGGPTFATKAIFMEAQAGNPPFPVDVESIDAVTCDTIALQWKAAFGDANLPSKGITILKTVVEDGQWKIDKINVEFNSLVWLLNMGGSYTWEDKTFTPEAPDPTLSGNGSTTAAPPS